MIAIVLRALDFAAVRHVAQRRKGPSGGPYVNHLIEVATLLATVAKVDDADILAAAILHDVVEDTDTSLEEVGRLFGVRVRDIVGSVSDDKSLSKDERKRLVLEHLTHADDQTKLVKLADVCSNIASLPSDWTKDRLSAYVEWAARAAQLCAGVNLDLDAVFLARLAQARSGIGG